MNCVIIIDLWNLQKTSSYTTIEDKTAQQSAPSPSSFDYFASVVQPRDWPADGVVQHLIMSLH